MEYLNSDISDEELLTRDQRAYWMTARRTEGSAPIPSSGGITRVEDIGDKRYVTMGNGDGILAVYRLRNDGVLKRLVRWPKGL